MPRALHLLREAWPRRVVPGWRASSPHADRFRAITRIFRQARDTLWLQAAQG